MDILNTIREEKDFRYALWSNKYSLSKIDFLFEILCSSLLYDHKNLPKRRLNNGDTVELSLTHNNELKRLYLKYDGIIDDQGIKKIILKVDDLNNTTYKLNASHFFWRLNKSEGKKLTSFKQLNKYSIANPPTGSENPIKILSLKLSIPYEEYNFFNRTSILLLTKQPFDVLISSLKNWENEGHSFLDYFPAYHILDSGKINKINAEKFDRSEPERILNIFSDLTELLDFINKGESYQNFFIISDSYSRLFNIKFQQYFLQTISNNNFRVKLLYFGNLSDFKIMNKEGNILLKNKYIQPMIINNNIDALKNLKSKIHKTGDNDCNELIIESLNYSKKYMSINPHFAGELKKIIFALCSLNRYETEIFANLFENFCKEYENDAIIIKIRVLRKNIQDNGYKQIDIFDNDLLVTDYSIKSKKDVIGEKEFKEIILNDSLSSYIICFFNPNFFNDFLFPAITLGYISTDMISFRFYSMESRVFIFILRNFLRKYKEFIGNEKIEEYLEETDSNVTIEDVNLFEFDFSAISSRPKEGSDKKIRTMLIELEDDRNEYVAFLSQNYSPTIITSDAVFDSKPDELEIGDELLFLPGVRNVLQKFSEIFENKEVDISLRNKWKDALREFLKTHPFHTLLIQLKRFGINRTESTIKNWINNSSVIGTSKPHEDFQKIAKATANDYLKHNYLLVADVCVTLQKISKMLGRRIKKLSISALRGTNTNIVLEEYEPEIQARIEEIVNGMKIVTVTNMDKDYREIDSNMANQLLEKEKLKGNAF